MPSYLLYKPYGVLSQFTDSTKKKRTLKDVYPFPPHVYPIGRLDENSEGLLILSDEKGQNQRILGGKVEKEYWVQVEGIPNQEAIQALREGVRITVRKKPYHTQPATVQPILQDPILPERNPPIRFRKQIPTSWLSIVLKEGKNRQVRKMTAKVGYPTLRLVRWRIGSYTLQHMQVGEVVRHNKPLTF
ncbi:MAG: pseudouridine synthase [Bacteroidota bacterium]